MLESSLFSKIGSTFFIESNSVDYLSLAKVAIVGNVYNITVKHVPISEIFRNLQIESSIRIQDLFRADSRRAMLPERMVLDKGPFKLECELHVDDISIRFQYIISEGTIFSFSWQLSIQWRATAVTTLRLERMGEVLRKVFPLARLALTIPVLGVPVKVSVSPSVTIAAEVYAMMAVQLSVPLRNTKVITVAYTAAGGWSCSERNLELSSGGLAESQLRMSEGDLQARPSVALGFTFQLPLVACTLELQAYARAQLSVTPRTFMRGAGAAPPFAGAAPVLADRISLRYGLQVSADARAGLGGLARSSIPLLDSEIESTTLPTIAVRVRGFGCRPDGNRYVHLEGVVAQGIGTNSLLAAAGVQWFLNTSREGLTLVDLGAAGADVVLLRASGGQLAAGLPEDATAFAFGTPAFPGAGYRVIGAFRLSGAPLPQCCGNADCGALQQCDTGACVRRGNPRFSLYWEGIADLDLHVITPNGYEIFFSRTTSGDGGRLDVDYIPAFWGRWIENIFWPPDGTAPRGTYAYWVNNYRGEASPWTLRVYQVDAVVEERTGVVGVLGDSARFQFRNG